MSDRKNNTKAIEKSSCNDVEVKNGNGHEAHSPWTYRPLVDVVEQGDEYVIFADLPGVDRDDVELGCERGVLTIDARVKSRYPSNARVYGQEYGVGNFHRRFAFDDTVDTEKANAEFRDGVLAIRLPKRTEAQRRRIPVQS